MTKNYRLSEWKKKVLRGKLARARFSLSFFHERILGGKYMNIKLSKRYIERQYKNALMDYITAQNEDEKWCARKIMAMLEKDAIEMHGTDYVNSLRDKLQVLKIGHLT